MGRHRRRIGTLTAALAVLAVTVALVPLLADATGLGLGLRKHAPHRVPPGLAGGSNVEEGEEAVETGSAIEAPEAEAEAEPSVAPAVEAPDEPEAEPEADLDPAVEIPIETDVSPAIPLDPAPAPTPPTSLYWGAWIGNQLTGSQPPWDMNPLTKFEQMAGKGLSTLNFSAPFANCASSPCSFYKFPAKEMEAIRAHGSIPFFSWASQSIPSQREEPDFQLSDVIAGRYDPYIHEWASAAREWGHPFFLRFNWEMNGRWFPWSEGVNGNGPGEFVTAWRHVHDIFTAVGATNATWVWCPNVDPGNVFLDLASQYPGNAYVDWTGLDGYNWGTNPAKPDRWRSFDQLYGSTYQRIVGAIAPTKPMAIGEISSTEYGGSKAAWISEALATIPADYPRIRAVLWFEKFDSSMDWPIETSESATAAFAAGIQNDAFLSNIYGDLSASPIPPPN